MRTIYYVVGAGMNYSTRCDTEALANYWLFRAKQAGFTNARIEKVKLK